MAHVVTLFHMLILDFIEVDPQTCTTHEPSYTTRATTCSGRKKRGNVFHLCFSASPRIYSSDSPTCTPAAHRRWQWVPLACEELSENEDDETRTAEGRARTVPGAR